MAARDDLLSRAPLFVALDDEAAAALRAAVLRLPVQRGATIFAEGDEGDRLYVILDGKVKLTQTSFDGRENVLAVMGPGDMFGELSLFDPRRRTANAVAITDGTLAALPHSALRELITGRPEVSLELLRTMAQRLRKTTDALSDLVFSDVPGRVAKAILDMAERFGVQHPQGILVPHDLTQEELAQLVGASRETVNKALADFASRGWVRLEGRSVVILDLERLARRGR